MYVCMYVYIYRERAHNTLQRKEEEEEGESITKRMYIGFEPFDGLNGLT